MHNGGKRWRSCLRQRTTRQEVAASISERVTGISRVTQSLCLHLVALWTTQPLTEMNTTGFPWG